MSNGPDEPSIKVALQALSKVMFSGETGAVVASGIKGGVAAMEKPTYALARAAHEVVDDLPEDLFDQYAEVRPCGKLDRYAAVGMLIGDALGRPLMPARPFALAIGKKVQKEIKEIPALQSKARKTAARRGLCPEAAAAAVLCQPVKLTIPSAADCTAPLAPALDAPAEPASAPPEPAPAPSESVPSEPAQPVTKPPVDLPPTMQMARACASAFNLEEAHRAFDNYLEVRTADDDDYEEYVHARDTVKRETRIYRLVLQALAHEAPELRLCPPQVGHGCARDGARQ